MSWLFYLLEANAYLAVFYALYYFILSKETYYQLNRAYLLIASSLAFVIPLVQLGFLRPTNTKLLTGVQLTGTARLQLTTLAAEDRWTMENYLLAGYMAIACIFLIRFAAKIYQIRHIARTHKKTSMGFYQLVEITGDDDAFSFFNCLYVGKQLAKKQTVINHELIHVKQKHTWDIIFFEIIKIVNWFNPFVYLLQYSIKEIHEFIADKETVAQEISADIYTDFLLTHAYGIHNNVLTNSFFNKGLLKKRIIMLHQTPSGKSARLKYLLALPLCAVLLCASTLGFTKTYAVLDFAPGQLEKVRTAPADAPISNAVPQTSQRQKEDKVFTSVENNPEFPGGLDEFYKYLARTIHYPATAREKNIQGKVIITFIVEKDGALTHIKVVRGVSKDIDKEALRAMNLSPKWKPALQNKKPVRVAYTVPINFSLSQ